MRPERLLPRFLLRRRQLRFKGDRVVSTRDGQVVEGVAIKVDPMKRPRGAADNEMGGTTAPAIPCASAVTTFSVADVRVWQYDADKARAPRYTERWQSLCKGWV